MPELQTLRDHKCCFKSKMKKKIQQTSHQKHAKKESVETLQVLKGKKKSKNLYPIYI